MGAGDSEQIVLEADGSQVRREVDATNKVVQSYGDTVVRVSDRSKNSIDRLITSMTKQADVYGKTGVEKLIAQRDSLVQRYGNEQRAVDAISKSYNQMIDVERKLIEQKRLEEEVSRRAADQRKREAEEARRLAEDQSHFSPRYAIMGAKDIFEGRSTNAAAEGVNILSGLKGIPLLAGGAIAALGGIVAAAHSSAVSLGDFGLQMENLKLRTGIATANLNQFVYAAKVMGQDATIYERMMRGLSEALGENSKQGDKAREALQRLGVQVRDSNTGELRDSTQVLLNISSALKQLPEGFERDAVAMDLFKRAGIEALPVIENLQQNFTRAGELHLGIKDEDLKRWRDYREQMDEAGARWEVLKRSLMEPLAVVWNVTLKFAGQGISSGSVKATGFGGLGAVAGAAIGGLAGGVGAIPGAAIGAAVGIGASQVSDAVFAGKAPFSSQGPKFDSKADADYRSKVALRKGADDYIRSITGSNRRPEEQLHDAEAELAKLAKPVLGTSTLDEAKSYEAAVKKVENLKDQIKYTHELTEASKRLQSFDNSMNERALTPVGKLRQQLADFLTTRDGQAPLNAAQRSKAVDITNGAIDRELTKEEAEETKKYFKNILDLSKDHQKALDSDHKELVKSSGDLATLQTKPHFDDLHKEQNRIKEQDKSDLELYSVEAQHAGRVNSITSRRDGFAGELDAAKETFAVKQQIRDAELAAMKAHEGAYAFDKDGLGIAKEQARIELDSLKDRYAMEEKILELKQKEFEEVQKTTEKLVNTLFTKPGSFSKELGNTIHAAVLAPITHGISNVISTAITPVVFGKDGQSGISGALGGIFGGKQKNPVAISTDENTAATLRNTTALYTMASAIASGGRGSLSAPGAIGGPSIGNAGSILSGGFGGSPLSLGGFGFPMSTGGGGSASPSIMYSGGGGGGSAPGYSGDGSGSFGGVPISAGGGAGFGGIGGLLKGVQGTFSGGSGSGFKGILGGLKGTNWGGFTRADMGGTPGVDGQPGVDLGNTGRITGVGGVAGGLLSAGGMMLAQRGLLGSDRGTWKGAFEGAAGGAAIGMKFGGPIGAAIGGAVGLGIGLGEHFAGVESPENEAKRLVKSIYGVTIDNKMASQIVQIAQQKYANHVSLAIRDPDVRQMLSVYAAGTGQKIPMSATTPHAGSLVEQGGKLYQQATYQYGQAYSFQSNLPVAGGIATGSYPSSPSAVTLNINGQSAADLLEGRIANTVSPGFVQDRYSSALDSSNGRISNSATIQQPGLITS